MIEQMNGNFRDRMLEISSDSYTSKKKEKETAREKKEYKSFEKEKNQNIENEKHNVQTMTIEEEEEVKETNEEEEIKETSEDLREKIKKKELEEARAFLKELVEEEPVEGILQPPEDSEKEKKPIVVKEEKKPKKEKPKEKKPIAKEEKKVVKTVNKKEDEISPEEQERRDLAQLLIEINEGQESGILYLSSSGQNSRLQSTIKGKEKDNEKEKEKEKKINRKVKNSFEKEKKEKIQKYTSLTQIKKDVNDQKVETLTQEQLDLQEKQEVRELFRQFEEMQEEGLLKPTADNKVEEKTVTKVETVKKEKIRTPKKEQKKPTQPTTPIKQETPQEKKEYNEKEEVRELFRQLEEQQEEGLLHESDVSKPQKEVSQSSVKKEKVVTKKQEKPKIVKPTTTQVQNISNEPTLTPEELEKKELRDLFHQMEEEQEEGLLKFSSDCITSREPSTLSRKSARSTRLSQKSTKEDKSTEEISRTLSKAPSLVKQVPVLTAEELAEQEKRDLIELFKQLEEDEEEGLLRLPDEKSLSQLSMVSRKSTASKQRNISRQSNVSSQKNKK